MKAPKRRRPQLRAISVIPPGIDLVVVASRVRYVGSPEHKDVPSFAGPPRPRRATASICDRSFIRRLDEIQEWLQTAIEAGVVGGFSEGDFPRYVWYKDGDTVFEARLVNSGQGEYKGWPLLTEEWPEGIDLLYE